VFAQPGGEETKTEAFSRGFRTTANCIFTGGNSSMLHESMLLMKLDACCPNVHLLLQLTMADEQAALCEVKRQQLRVLDEQQKVYAADLSRYGRKNSK
jgi:hypothetical protein